MELLYSYMGQKQNVSGSGIGLSAEPRFQEAELRQLRPSVQRGPRQKRDLNHAPLLMKLHFNSPGPFATYSPLTIPSVA